MNFKQITLVSFLISVITSIVTSYAILKTDTNVTVSELPTTITSSAPTPIALPALPASNEVVIDIPNGYTLDDFIALGTCIDYEAEGESLENKLLYGSVVLNRVKCNNSIFKNYDTVEKVCLQYKEDGGFPTFRRLGKKDINNISKTSKDAALILLKDGSKLPSNVLYHDIIEKPWAKTYTQVKNESTPGYTYFQYVD